MGGAVNTAFAVVDLGFGDAGKGLVTDYLVREFGARLVVRFNGGAQAGHNVVLADGRHHTFAQFGAGSFVPGVRSHLARDFVVHPTALLTEADVLARAGVPAALTRLSIDPQCRIITPLHQAAGRLRELRRGHARHGSCGIGFGETVRDSLARPELTLRFAELAHPAQLRERLQAIRAEKIAEFADLFATDPRAEVAAERVAFTDSAVLERWLALSSAIARQIELRADEQLLSLGEGAPIVCEGAQGVLLDERYGFHPFTTWSRTTFDGAREALARAGFRGELERIGVHRSYAVRHGPGPFPTEDSVVTDLTREPHNCTGPWQREVRKGWLDFVLLEYALRACDGVDALALTHTDAFAAFVAPRFCENYREFARIELPRALAEQADLAARLGALTPQYRAVPAREAFSFGVQRFAELGAPVRWSTHGPTAAHVRRH